MCKPGPKLGHSAPAGGGRVVRVDRLCVGPLHQAAEAARQLPGLSNSKADP